MGKYLGSGTKTFIRWWSVLLMILVGAVFMSQPAELIAERISAQALSGVAFISPEGLTIYAIVNKLVSIDEIKLQ